MMDLRADAPNEIVLCPQTTDLDVVRERVETWTETGIEGVVAKGWIARTGQGSAAGELTALPH
jgi:hypothetical protein